MNKFQKYLVGTLFDEQQQQKKTNFQNMKAKDPFGNTRWKGAFTGGFQAGYKNTCGTKQGWVPATFVSSVHKKAEKAQRSIFDYMDKEDLGLESITNNITLTNNFDGKRTEGLNITIQESIGSQILNKLKKINAFERAPQNKQQLEKLFEMYSKQQEISVNSVIRLKDTVMPVSVGADISNIEQDQFVEAYNQIYKKIIRQHAKEETEEEIKKRKQENKIYFDFTKPLEEEPEYLKEIHEIQEIQKPKKRKKNLINQLTLKDLFTEGKLFKQYTIIQNIQKAPEDYDPYAKVKGLHILGKPKQPQQNSRKFQRLDADKRSELLGETKLSSRFVSSQNSLSNKFISNDKKVEQLKKFFEDEKKNKRYVQYVEQMQGKKISSRLEYLSYEQSERQRQQFETMYQNQKKIDDLPQNVLIKKNKQDALKPSKSTFLISRKTQSWRPQKVLCKRFNVLVPYTLAQNREQQQSYF